MLAYGKSQPSDYVSGVAKKENKKDFLHRQFFQLGAQTAALFTQKQQVEQAQASLAQQQMEFLKLQAQMGQAAQFAGAANGMQQGMGGAPQGGGMPPMMGGM